MPRRGPVGPLTAGTFPSFGGILGKAHQPSPCFSPMDSTHWSRWCAPSSAAPPTGQWPDIATMSAALAMLVNQGRLMPLSRVSMRRVAAQRAACIVVPTSAAPANASVIDMTMQLWSFPARALGLGQAVTLSTSSMVVRPARTFRRPSSRSVLMPAERA